MNFITVSKQLTARSRVLPKKERKKGRKKGRRRRRRRNPAFYGTRRPVTAFTSSRHQALF
jgi:hypothetical protein